ncbi:hypothetical protein [Companilactobacillus musae]|nr:hypothetical protein [Companilactobacillus musae]
MTRIDRLHQKRKTQRVGRNISFVQMFIVVAVIYFICQMVMTIDL